MILFGTNVLTRSIPRKPGIVIPSSRAQPSGPGQMVHGRAVAWRQAVLPRILTCVAGVGLVAGCAAPYKASPTIPAAAEAYAMMNGAAEQVKSGPYRISPEDTLSVNVFFEPDLSVANVKVDPSGQIALPGIGPMKAEDLTTTELANAIAGSLRGRLLRDPQVAVSVTSSARQRVVVTGQVQKPGVYEISLDTTLIETVARAGGETEIAKLDEVIVFRTINGQRMAARFDVAALMSGEQPDIPILGNDVVVVGYSSSRAFWRDLRQMVPVFALFRPLVM